MKPTETDVAAVLVSYLERNGADVYQEVTVRGGVADIVARVGVELWIVEVKTSLSLALVIQAMERRRQAHRVYIAAPPSRSLREVGMICHEVGIGLFSVRTIESWHGQQLVSVEVEGRRWNRRPVDLASRLSPEHKTHAKAGAVGAAGRWTPFRNTCEQVARIVERNPGATIREVIEKTKHHYSTDAVARSSLAKWVQEGAIERVVAKQVDGKIRLYPVEAAP